MQTAANSNATTMTDFRPIASERGPVNIKPNASIPVAIESDKLLDAGEVLKSCDNMGKIGCTQ
ncbi:hypothetical protein KD5_19090 [Yersinia pseudotuberculosis]|nr:hypothetical protein YP72344_18390 [Yersinia pseudotuberculosis]BET62513.1 hypothetical protein YPSE1_19720 [Yersinia pseudotuberculosis]